MTTGLGLLPLESAETRVDGSSLVQENEPQVNLPGPQQYPPFLSSTVTSEPFAGGFSSFGQPLFGHPVSLNGPPIMPQGVAASSESPFRSPLGQPSVFPAGQTSFGHPVSLNGQAIMYPGVLAHKGSPLRQSPLGQPLSSGNPPSPGTGNPPFGQQSSSQKSAFGQPPLPYKPPFGQQSSSQKSAFGQPPLSPKTAFGLKSTNHSPLFEKLPSFRDRSWFTEPMFKRASSPAKSPFAKPISPDSHEPSKS
ncbi:hypothetical protein RU639_013491 [Aspergillus parasiticus]